MGYQCAYDGVVEKKIRIAASYELQAASLSLKIQNYNYEKF